MFSPWFGRTPDRACALESTQADKDERRPLDDPELRAEGEASIASYLASEPTGEGKAAADRVLDEEARRKVEALGYVE